MRKLFGRGVPSVTVLLFLLAALALGQSGNKSTLKFEVSFPASVSAKPLDGHIILGISKKEKPEPRFLLLEEEAESQQFFGLDVDGLAPGRPATFDSTSLGYPLRRLDEVPPGDYYIQAVLNIYETFHRSDGHTLKLPPDMGEGQAWNRKPGNLLSKPQKVHIDPSAGGVIRISLSEKIPAIEPPKDTKWVKHFRIESKLLSEFWGRPMYLGAIVVLPEGFDEHPNAHYPLIVEQGHFDYDFRGFREQPPAPDLKGRQLEVAKAQYRTFQDWSGGRLPRVLLLIVQHANPYYDDSYAVNSANVGPYGDAITQELIPEVEKRFRGIGQGWARATFGGSTGGWEALASQIFYPDFYNGSYGFCPDPIDFHAYQAVNIYDDENAFWELGPFGRVPRPEMRTSTGMVNAVMEPAVRREEVMGTHGRSTEQFGIWQAVFSPVGPDGYPKQIWNPATGVIDKSVAKYWQDHYDLNHILQRDIDMLGPKLAGKIHITVGDMDTWYLNNAVHLTQDFLDSSKNKYRIADFDYGYMQPHCYTGGKVPNSEGYSSVLQRIMPVLVKHMEETAPQGADMSWKY